MTGMPPPPPEEPSNWDLLKTLLTLISLAAGTVIGLFGLGTSNVWDLAEGAFILASLAVARSLDA